MTTFIAWLATLAVTLSFLHLTADLTLFIDLPTLIFMMVSIYGLSVVIYGAQPTLQSIAHMKHLFLNKQQTNTVLSELYLSQIKLTVIIAIIGLSAGLLGFFFFYDNSSAATGPALSVLMPLILYPAVFIGFIFYPLYKKLS